MPGICGILDTNRSLDLSAALARMVRPMQHHDWYRTEQHVNLEVGLALGRVTLGFVNRAVQPARTADGRLTGVMDGELYEPERLAAGLGLASWDANQDNQAALLLGGYQAAGEDFLRDVYGSFAAAIWDAPRRCLILVNDRFGTRPVYYAAVPGRFVLGSSLRSVMTDEAVSRQPGATGLAQFFTFGHYLRDETSVEAVRVLPAAAHVAISADGLMCRVERYASVGGIGEESGDLRPARSAGSETRDERSIRAERGTRAERGGGLVDGGSALSQIDEAFVRAVDRRVAGTEHLGLSLSGGLDARSILAVIDHSQIALQTVCLGMPGSLDHRSSAQLAALVGCPHRNHVLGGGFLANFRQHLEDMVRLTDGQYLSQCIVMPTLPLYRELGIQVLLRGHAGELMHMTKAYNYSLDRQALEIRTDAQLEEWLFGRLQAYMLRGVDRPLFRGELQRDMAGLARESLRQDLQDVAAIQPPLQRLWALFVTQRLRRETVLSMVKFRSVVEPRLPYLDHELVELLLAAPPQMKLAEEIQAYILGKRRPSFLGVVNANTGARVGASPLARRAASLRMRVLAKLGVPGYQPYERLGLWLRRELAPTVRDILLDEQTLDNGVYDPDGVRRVIQLHMQNQQNLTYLLMAMMIYELGRRQLLVASC